MKRGRSGASVDVSEQQWMHGGERLDNLPHGKGWRWLWSLDGRA
jgi:hypothetical protein